MSSIIRFYHHDPSSVLPANIRRKCQQLKLDLRLLKYEHCYHLVVERQDGCLGASDDDLRFLLSTSRVDSFGREPHLIARSQNECLVEIGPRLAFTTAFSTNAVSALRGAGVTSVRRLERSTRYLLPIADGPAELVDALHDRMTECVYDTPPVSFDSNGGRDEGWRHLDLLSGSDEHAARLLQQENVQLGLALDSADKEYYLDLFRHQLKRNPTDVELFDLAQSNSEHSRHWFFKGSLYVDGKLQPCNLFDQIQATVAFSNPNNVIKFCDNSSGIEGYSVKSLRPSSAPSVDNNLGVPLSLYDSDLDIIFTAETHNFPTGVCPFAGATTGTGGRLRDVHAAGRGAHEIAATVGYSFGDLHIPGYRQPWERQDVAFPPNLASALDIAIGASDGASDYGNKFGEPVICGFARSFGGATLDGRRVEYLKPIMFSGGVGAIQHEHIEKEKPAKGMLVVKLGGPVYRIGVGGGSASSVSVQGASDRSDGLDFGAVQRGDAEMEQKLHRVIRACIEMGADNPILAIHDQGAGGNGNVIKELVEGAGAVIEAAQFELGDPTITERELWSAEYQESDAALVDAKSERLLRSICERERCPIAVVGRVSDDNKIVLKDFDGTGHPVDLDLGRAFGSSKQKVFNLTTTAMEFQQCEIPSNMTVEQGLHLVLRLPSVASKRYLTNKVDRSVTGLIAQQQCVGPLHTPVADVGVVALSHFDTKGSAVAMGEQPIKGLVDAACGARMSLGEALTNMVFARISDRKDIKCSGNWMWAVREEGEGARLVAACQAMCALMQALGVAVDGGKDSLSMAARVGDKVVVSPGTLVISVYAPCPDITRRVNPALRCPNNSGVLVYVSFGTDGSQNRLAGSALAQCLGCIGGVCADVDDADRFANAFDCTQKLLDEGLLTAGHDVSDGGIITTLLEMAFAGDCGISVDIANPAGASPLSVVFAEELGIVVEMSAENEQRVLQVYADCDVYAYRLGQSHAKSDEIELSVAGERVFCGDVATWRDVWEETSFELEKLQSNAQTAEEQRLFLRSSAPISWHFDFDVAPPLPLTDKQPKVAVVREEGCNSDREMAAAFKMADFEVFDVTMQDLLTGDGSLDAFRGVVFVGGFSYADVLGSAKGWAAAILFHEKLRKEFDRFYRREDTFSLGVCNGCQLMALLGWVGAASPDVEKSARVELRPNDCQRFQSGFPTVRVERSPAVLLKDMDSAVLGVWVANGEGKFAFESAAALDELEAAGRVALRYVTAGGGASATAYPENPSGSARGVAALCSADGRHLAVMPHPERCFLSWQWPHWPFASTPPHHRSPWMRMFINARLWCDKA